MADLRLRRHNGHAPRQRRGWVQRLILTLNVLLIACSLFAAATLQYGFNRASDIRRVELGRNLTPVSTEVAVGERVINILLVGSDSSAGLDPTDPVQIGRQGERFGDVIIVAHIDERTKQIAMLSFPRDLWVPLAGTNRRDRINRAFQLGGPAMLIDTIETTFNLPIHHYVNVDFAGFQGLVEAVGSVDIYFETPARDWNVNAQPEPRSQTGFIVEEAGCHALDPPTALAYVRSRFYQTQLPDGTWVTDPRSDFGRITRQQDFLRRLMFRAIDLGARNPFVLKDLIDAGLANVAIDDQLTPQLLLDVGSTYQSFDPDQLQTYSIPAVDANVEGNQVLQPQWDEAEPLLTLMRGAAFGDPATVKVALVGEIGADPETANLQQSVADQMMASGYVIQTHALTDVQGGITVHHGTDGRAAASQVVEEVRAMVADAGIDPSAIALVQNDELKGRSVQVRFGHAGSADGGDNAASDASEPTNSAPTDPSNSAQSESDNRQNRNQNPTSATPGPTTGVDPDRTNGASASTLVGSEAGKQVSAGDALDSIEAACRT